MTRRTTPDRRPLVNLALVAVMCALAVSTVPFRARADSGGIEVNVEVLGTSATPTPTATSRDPDEGPGAGTTEGRPTSGAGATASSSASTGSSPTGRPTASASTTPTGETSIGGVLFISGLTMSYTPSVNPLEGHVDLRFLVRNAYRKALGGRAVLWVTAWSGNRVGHEVEVEVTDIAPGETRVVSASVSGVGQWGLLTGHATFIPPKSLDQVTLTAVTRTGTVMYVPWFPVVCAAGGSAVWFARRRRFQWAQLLTGSGR